MMTVQPPASLAVPTQSAEFYQVRKGYEWAFICLHEATGVFMAQSSFGTFGYIWTHRGGQTLKEFLADLQSDYFFGKTNEKTRGHVFDSEKTIKNIKLRVIEERKYGFCFKETAREIFDALEEIGGTHEDEVMRALYESEPIREFFQGDIPSSRSMDPQCQGFWEKIWPAFLEQINVKIAA